MKKENQECTGSAAVSVAQLVELDRTGHGHRRSLLVSSVVHSGHGGALLEPHISILTWMVVPAFLVLRSFLTAVGELRERRRRKGAASLMSMVQIDLSRPRDRRNMAIFLAGAVFFLLLSAVGSYNSYQFTESVQFCGETCHTVMKPELTAHALGPHARVACAECHIGPGASWFVRSKLSGSYQFTRPPSTNIRVPFPRRLKICVPRVKPASNAIGQGNSSGTWIKPFITL